MKKTAYVSEEKVIELAELSGLELDARSEINANPKDTKDSSERRLDACRQLWQRATTDGSLSRDR